MAIVERTVTCPSDTTLETLMATPEGHQIMTCLQCGTCAGTCPYGEDMEYPPRAVINMLWRGLLDEVIAFARRSKANSLYLEVRVSNTIARKFYSERRFVPTYLRKGYYENGEDAVIMEREVDSENKPKSEARS